MMDDERVSVATEETTANHEKTSGQGGGRTGVVAVLTLWSLTFILAGFLKGLGIMLQTLEDQFISRTWVIGWITAMMIALCGITGPFVGIFIKRFGTGVVITTSGFMIGLSAIAASFTNNALQLGFILISIGGIGMGVAGIASKVAVGNSYRDNFATAIGIGRTGFATGMFVLAPLIQLFLNTYGWRGTFLLIGAISMHLVVCGALMIAASQPKPASTDYEIVQQSETPLHPPPPLTKNQATPCFKTLSENLDLGLLLNIRYWSMAILYCSTEFTNNIWFIYFVSLVQSKGFSLQDGAAFVAVAGTGNLIANIIQGVLVDRRILSTLTLMTMCTILSSVSFYALPFLASYWTLMASSLLLLSGQSVLKCLCDVITKDQLGVDLLAGAYGWFGIKSGVLYFALGFLPGWNYDSTGSYDAACIVLGSIQALPLISLLMIKYANVRDGV